MIHDSCKNLKRYLGIHPNLDCAVRFILQQKHMEAVGRVDIAGEQVYATGQSVTFASAEERRWETHRRYLDIHVALTDGETIACLPDSTGLTYDETDESADCAFSSDSVSGTLINLKRGECVLLFPGEPHKPLIGAGSGHKVVFKVEIT